MTVDGNILTAENGKAIRRKGDADYSTVTRVALTSSDSADYWDDCYYGVPPKYSRWGFIYLLEMRGLADKFDAYLDANKAAFRRFYGPQFFNGDDPDFKEMLKTFQDAFSLSDDYVAAILAESPYTPE